MIIEEPIHFGRQKHGRKALHRGEQAAPRAPRETGRVPRIARLLALAHRFDHYLQTGKVADQSDLAALGQVSRARISQIMNLLNLAPDIQAEILFLPRIVAGRDPIILRHLQPIASTLDWSTQRSLWRHRRQHKKSLRNGHRDDIIG